MRFVYLLHDPATKAQALLAYTNFQAPRCVTENYFSYFSTKTYVVGTQKNRLDQTVLLSTKIKCLN